MGVESLIFGGLSAAGGLMQASSSARAAKQNGLATMLELQGQYEQVGTQNEQLLQEVDLIRLSAEGQVRERMEQLNKVKENNTLFMAASGLSFNNAQEVAGRVSDKKAGNDVQVIE